MKSSNLILLAATLLVIGGCASKPEPVAKAAKAEPAPGSVTLDEINLAIENDVKLQNEKGEEMVCRREPKVGSRLARETICMTKAEWIRVADESQRATRKSMRTGKIPHGGD